MLKSLLAHPLTRGLDLDDPRTTHLRGQIIQQKSFLRQIYQEWYFAIAGALPGGMGSVVELGSGAGFLKDCVPDLITSDMFCSPGVEIVLSGLDLPFAAGSVRGIVMIDVLHHLSQPRRFFTEAARCVRPGGIVAMIEPWVTPWSRLIYTRMHHEPFKPEAVEWEFPASGPLSAANGALPWIIFARDRQKFEQEFPQWQIEVVKPIMPFRYLISGGVSLRSLTPNWSFGLWRHMENVLGCWSSQLAMFAQIILRRLD